MFNLGLVQKHYVSVIRLIIIVLINTVLIVSGFIYIQKDQPEVQVTIAVFIVVLLLVLLLFELMIIREKNELISKILREQGESILREANSSQSAPEENNGEAKEDAS